MIRPLLVLAASFGLSLVAGTAYGQTDKSSVPKRSGIECRGDFLIAGVYAIRRDTVRQVHLVRDQTTGKLKYGLLTFDGDKGVEQLMIWVNDFGPIVDCLGR